MKNLFSKEGFLNLKVNRKKFSRWKVFSCASLLLAIALVFTMAFSSSKINADGDPTPDPDALYIDEEGHVYKEEDLVTYEYDNNTYQAKWNLSMRYYTQSINDDFWAYLFKKPDSNYMLVITGSDTNNMVPFEYAYQYDGYEGEVNATKYDGSTSHFYANLDNWWVWRITPWSLLPEKTYIDTIVIDKGCNVPSYDMLGAGLSKFKNFTLLANEGETKTPTSMRCLFYNAGPGMQFELPECLDTSNVTNIDLMFSNSYASKIDLTGFDSSSITSMYKTFNSMYQVTEIKGLENFNTSSVTNFENLFYSCSKLESLDLSGWDVSNVSNFTHMFYGCEKLEEVDLTDWNPENGESFEYMFQGCKSLTDLDFSTWNLTKANSFREIFHGCKALKEIEGISDLNTVTVSNFSYMFQDCESLTDLDLSSWDVSNSSSFSYMFSGCKKLKKLNISTWENKANDYLMMNGMFYNAEKLSYIDLSSMNMSWGCNGDSVFSGSGIKAVMLPQAMDNASLEVDSFNYYNKTGDAFTPVTLSGASQGNYIVPQQTENVEPAGLTLNFMCSDDYFDSLPIWTDSEGNDYSKLDISKYWNPKTARDEMARWNISDTGVDDLWATVFKIKGTSNYMLVITGEYENIVSFDYLYNGYYDGEVFVTNRKGENKSLSDDVLINLPQNNVAPWSITGTNMKKVIISSEANPNSYDFICAATHCEDFIIEPFEDGSDKKTNSMCFAFAFTNMTSFSLPSFLDTSDVKDASYMFNNAFYLTSIDLTNFNPEGLDNVEGLFRQTSNLTSITGLNHIVLTENVKSLKDMFYYASSLTSLDLSNLDVSSVEKFDSMFEGASELVSIDFTGWDVPEGKSFNSMFWSCEALASLDLSSWGMEKAEDLSKMFSNCKSLETLDITGWKPESLTALVETFRFCSKLTSLDLSSWDVSKVENFGNMFKKCELLETINLSGWETGIDKSIYYGSMFEDTPELKTIDLSGFYITDDDYASYMFYNSGIHSVVLPKVNVKTDIWIPNELYYYNKKGCNLKPVTLNGESKSHNLGEETSEGVLPAGLTLNFMCDDDYLNNLPIYVDSEGNEYGSSDLYSSQTRWNISSSGEGDLWANLFKVKGSDTDLMLVLTGQDTEVMNFDYYLYDEYYNEYRDETGTTKTIRGSVSYRSNNVTPWTLLDYSVYYKIKKVVIAKGCNPESYKMLAAGLANLEEFIFEFDEDETKKAKSMQSMFLDVNNSNFSFAIPEELDLSELETISHMFYNCQKIEEIDFTYFDNTINLLDMKCAFEGCKELASIIGIEDIITSKVTCFTQLFRTCQKLGNVDVSSWDTSSGEEFNLMFDGNESLTEIDVSNFDMGNATSLYAMFQGTGLLNIDLSNWVLKDQSMNGLFQTCENLISVKMPTWGPDDDNYHTIRGLFGNCTNLKFLDMSNMKITSGCDISELIGVSPICPLKEIRLPKALENSTTLTLDSALRYYNYDGEKYTPLRLNGEVEGDVIISETNVNVTNLDGSPTTLRINCMKEVNSLPEVINILVDEIKYAKDNDIEIKVVFSEAISLISDVLPELKFSFTGNASNVLSGGNSALAAFKEITGDTITFIYKVMSDDNVEKGSSIKIEDILNKNSIVSSFGLNLGDINKTKLLSNFEIDTYVPEPSPSGHKKKKPVVEEPPVIQEPVKEKIYSHRAIMEGYEDKTFKPKGLVTREEVAVIVARGFESFSEQDFFLSYNIFSDSSDRWSNNYLGFCKSKDLINGYEDGSFHPTDYMTRAELAVLISNFSEIKEAEIDTSKESIFEDVRGRWFEPYVNRLNALGIIIGYDDGEFKGENPVTRTEMAIVMNRVNGRNVDNIPEEYMEKVASEFLDVNPNSWCFKDIAQATLDLPDEWFEN